MAYYLGMVLNPEILSYVVVAVITFVVGRFSNSFFKKVDSVEDLKTDITLLKKSDEEMTALKKEWRDMIKELTRLITKMESVEKSMEEVTILQRDLKSVWRHIDGLKGKNFDKET